MTLHILSAMDAIEDCLAVVRPGDELIFRDIPGDPSQVIAAIRLTGTEIGIYWLGSDESEIAATLSAQVSLVGYREFVDLCVKHPNSASWG